MKIYHTSKKLEIQDMIKILKETQADNITLSMKYYHLSNEEKWYEEITEQYKCDKFSFSYFEREELEDLYLFYKDNILVGKVIVEGKKEQLEQILFKEQMKRLDKIKEKLDKESQDELEDIINQITYIEMCWGTVVGATSTIPNDELTHERIKSCLSKVFYPKTVDEMADDYIKRCCIWCENKKY